MSNSTSPAATPFSYAQAARGRAAAQPAPKSPETTPGPTEQNLADAKSSTSEPGKLDLTSTTTTPKTGKSRKSSAGSEPASDEHQISLDHNVTLKENLPLTNEAKSATEEIKTITATSTSINAQIQQGADILSQPSKSGTPSSQQNDASESWDKQSEFSTYVEKSTQTNEKAKSKDSEDDWEKISSSAYPVETQLRPAPVPAVNIWVQRKAEQAAKAKDSANVQRPAVATSPLSSSKPKSQAVGGTDDSKRKALEKAGTSTEREGTGRKRQDTTRPAEGTRREQAHAPAPRPVSQSKDCAEPSLPPPVGDAESWPTPDTVSMEERRKSATFERPDTKVNGAKSHTNKWTPVPYVPSVVFETQLPPAAARRGGRPSNRGREGNARGALNANNTSVDKTDANTMPPPPLPRHHTEQDRGRRADGARGGRAASVPTQGKRSSSVTTMDNEGRKVSETAGRDRVNVQRNKTPIEEPSVSTESREATNNTSTQDSISRSATSTAVAASAAQSKNGSAVDTHAHPFPETEARQSTDWSRSGGHQGQRNVTDPGKEKQFKQTSARDKVDSSSRAKVESWQDQPDQPGRRESRSERGRGGNYRGNRPSHAAYNNNQSGTNQPYNGPGSQQGFVQKQYGFGPNPNRNNSRSQTIPAPIQYSPYPNTMQGMPPLSPIQTDMTYYGPYGQMQAGIMSAISYSTPLESYALMAMVSQQVEYYFSIDNLCKDMFLRRNMDSQGWVPIGVIANFKRIRSLTEDMNLLRMVCSRLAGVEYLPGENVEQDRLRSREKWSEFVLDAKDRLPEARVEGSSQQAQMSPQLPGTNYPQFQDPYYAAASQVRSPTWNQAAFHGGPAPMMSPTLQTIPPQLDGTIIETPMSATIPDYLTNNDHLPLNSIAPNINEEIKSPKPQGLNGFGPSGLTNGYHVHSNAIHETEDVFPNESIAALRVVSRKFDTAAGQSHPQFISNSTRTFSNGSIEGLEGPASATISGLRGGAGSPEQLERLQMPQSSFVHRPSQLDAPPILWVKEGAPPVGLHQEGMTHEFYHSVRDRAMQQRLLGQSSEDMDLLYQFWSHFLVRNFNTTMYEEFHDLALDDLQNGQDCGAKHLVRYYEAVLTSQTTLSDRLVQDIVAMAGNEPGNSRLAFQKLRSAWRNGAFSMKSRNKINKILPASLKAELEK